MTDELFVCIKKKHRLYKLSFYSAEQRSNYKSYRNTLQNIILRAKRNYYENKFKSAKKDSKSVWKLINNVLKPKLKKNEWKIRTNDTVTENETEIAGIFNKYFSTVATDLAAKIPSVQQDPLHLVSPCLSSFVYFVTTPVEIENIIKSFKNKSSSINEIPPSVFKHVSIIISPIISNLINCSVSQGIFPKCLKTARVVPIHKSGCKNVHTNFRPISTLPLLSKVFEKTMHKRIIKFFSKFNLLFSDQFGFLSKKSTSDAILKFTDKCYSNFNDKNVLNSIFIDLSKAFNILDLDFL